MAVFNRFVSSVTTNEWVVEGGGTALEAIGKEALSTETPSTVKSLKSAATIGKKVSGTITLPTLTGEKFITAVLKVYKKEGVVEALKYGFVSPAVTKLGTAGTGNAWETVSLTKAQAEALASGGEVEWLLEVVKAKSCSGFEVYLEVTTEATGEVVAGKATGALLLTGTAKGTTAAVVSGKATGPLLLAGTAKGTAAQRVEGKATGAFLLAGTSTGTVRSVVAAKATGALLFTGTAKGQVAGALRGKASGAILLTGTATATVREVKTGKASGTLRLTGTATGTVKEGSPVVGKASGALTFTGTSKGLLRAVVTASATGTLRFTGSATSTSGEVAEHVRIVITDPPLTRLTISERRLTRITHSDRPLTRITIRGGH